MTETEFLEHLGKRLHVLKEKERDDILSEYAQHIELKMKSGLSEEEAIRDFGDLEELAAEILDAYNVNPDYDKKTAHTGENRLGRLLLDAGRQLGRLGKRCMSLAGGLGEKCVSLMNNLGNRCLSLVSGLFNGSSGSRPRTVLTCCLILAILFIIYLPLSALCYRIGNFMYRHLSWPFDSLVSYGLVLLFHLFYLFFTISVIYNYIMRSRQSQDELSQDGLSRWTKVRGRFAGMSAWIKNLFVLPDSSKEDGPVRTKKAGNYMKKLSEILRSVLIFAVRLAVLCILVPFLLFSLFLVVACGTLVVLSLMGYPVIGLTVLTFGGLLSGSAFICLVGGLLFSEKAREEE